MNTEKMQKKINYFFDDIMLLKTALVHRSYLHERDKDEDIREHNERLEFLGDAVLELIITDFLYREFGEQEGYLTNLRSALVNHNSLKIVGDNLDLPNQICISKGERDDGDGTARSSITADGVEALIGAIYLDGGYNPARDFIHTFILPLLDDIVKNKTYKDSKTKLQELSQKEAKETPTYKVISSEGKDHEKMFKSGVWIKNKKLGEGEGKSKQLAEQSAATNALENFDTIIQENLDK